MKKKFLTLILFATSLLICAQEKVNPDLQSESRLKTLPVLWMQTSAEYRALCYQAFNLASLRVNAIPPASLKKTKMAIITDLDETILDNSPGDAQLIKEGQLHSGKSWKEWTDLYQATAVPGAVEFLQMAHKKGISVFYISNRDTSEIRSTLTNLKNLQLPDAVTDHLLFKSSDPSKESRRLEVMKKHKVILLLGDNLNDFTTAFEKATIPVRKSETDKIKEEWGRKFIVLPNSTYGEWENALYNYSHKLTIHQKDSMRIQLLKGFK